MSYVDIDINELNGIIGINAQTHSFVNKSSIILFNNNTRKLEDSLIKMFYDCSIIIILNLTVLINIFIYENTKIIRYKLLTL